MGEFRRAFIAIKKRNLPALQYYFCFLLLLKTTDAPDSPKEQFREL